MESYPQKVVEKLISIITESRKAQGLTLEDLADRAGIHRTTVGLWEREARTPTLDNAISLASALGMDLSGLLAQAEAAAKGVGGAVLRSPSRIVEIADFHNEAVLDRLTGLTAVGVKAAIEGCYLTLDTIDRELLANASEPVARLVELANLSSMIGNLLGAQIAVHSNNLYQRNKPHTYPDLIPVLPNTKNLEIKIALETNSPKGHLPKPGTYLTFRYVLADGKGDFKRGKDSRGDTAYVWEGRVGELQETDFSISNTAGDSGKTAVIKTTAFDAMSVFYYVPTLNPYAKQRASHPIKGGEGLLPL